MRWAGPLYPVSALWLEGLLSPLGLQKVEKSWIEIPLPGGASGASLPESQLSPPPAAGFLVEGVLKRQWSYTGRSGPRKRHF